MRLLIAEDDNISRKILESMLRKWGHEVVAACDGNQAWTCLQQNDAPGMVILDWMMPGMDGIDVCIELRKLPKEIRPYVILLTGMQHKKDLIRAISAGADDYITKPFEPEELKVRIHAGERILNLQVESLAARKALIYQANHDSLTRLWNRGWILDRLARELAEPSCSDMPTSIIMADLDNFKKINDTKGHQVGDMVLAEAARRMAGELSGPEDIGRCGGEEFLAVLPQCELDTALQTAESMRNALASKAFITSGGELDITGSFGVASSSHVADATPQSLLQMADEAMYRAKARGRNQVQFRTSEPLGFFSKIVN